LSARAPHLLFAGAACYRAIIVWKKLNSHKTIGVPLVLLLSICLFVSAAGMVWSGPGPRSAAARLLQGAEWEAFGLVLVARDSGPGRRYARARLERLLGRVPDERELRDLDHYLNAYEAVRPGSLGDYLLMTHIVPAYSAFKWIDQQNSATDLLGWASLGRWAARSPGTSRASRGEVLAGWQGAKDGYNR